MLVMICLRTAVSIGTYLTAVSNNGRTVIGAIIDNSFEAAWVKKCMEHEVEGPRPRGRPKKTWKEVVREDCQARKLNKEEAMDRCKWRKMIKEAR